MPKTKISEYSVTNSSNTDIEGINIDEGCAPSGINNAIRELMVHLKEFQTGASGDAFTFAGGVLISGTANTITGNVLMSGTNTITGSTTATFAAGAVGTPSIAAHGDTNTGIYFPAADTIAFAEGGAEAMRITSSGNLDIGGSAYARRLSVKDTTNTVVVIEGSNAGSSNINFADSDSENPGSINYGHATNYMAFQTAGSERMRIDSSGNVGIGTTGYGTYFSSNKNISLGEGANIRASASGGDPYITISSNAYFTNTPDWKYVVTDFASSYEQYNGAHVWSSAASGTAGNTITFTERMRIDSSGNVGIGTSSPLAKLDVVGTDTYFRVRATNGSSAQTLYQNSDTGTGGSDGLYVGIDGSEIGYLWNFENQPLAFGTNNTERARIAASGQMSLISTADGLHVGSTQASGTATWLYRGASAATAGTANSGTDRFFVFTNGNVTNSNGSYGTISDAKLKQDIIDAGSQWADIKNLRFRKYRMKSDVAENPNAPYLLGFVAQELETISPGLIEEHPDTTIETKTREVEKTREIPAVLDEEGNEVEPARTETYTETEEYTETVDLGTTTKSIKTSILYMKAVKALQEAMTRIEALEAEVAAMKAGNGN